MIDGGFPAIAAGLAAVLKHAAVPDIINATLEFVGGCLIWMHTARAWRDEEIKGVHWGPFVFFWTWGVYNLWYYSHIGQPISGAVAFMPCLATTAYLFTYWIFAGNFNYEKRNDRARWWFLSRINRLRGPRPTLGDMLLDAIEQDRRDEVLRDAALPSTHCNTCGFVTRHDLDGHCMICDHKGD